MLELQRPELTELKPRITVIGVGGAGGNAVANMIASSLDGVDFVVMNTDAQALSASEAETRIQLGLKITQGLGAGARPEIGRAAAEETLPDIEGALDGAHMCFITAGMGGGTGTGAAPVVAQAARERGILTVGVVTKPFAFEGAKRARAAEDGIDELQKHVDTLIVIPNQNLFMIANANTTFKEAFAMADQVLHQGVRGITDLMVMPGLINLDFADIRTVMSEMGKAMMGTGEAEGEGRAIEAADKAIANPLLDEVSMRGAKAVIINITGGDDMTLMEFDEAANHIREMVDSDANIIVGSAFNDGLDGRIRVSVVATGIDSSSASATNSQSTAASAGFGTVAGGFGAHGVTPVRAAAAADTAAAKTEAAPEQTPADAPSSTAAEADLPLRAGTGERAEAQKTAKTSNADETAQPADTGTPTDNVMPLHARTEEAEESAGGDAEPERPYARPSDDEQSAHTEERGPTLFERLTSMSRGGPEQSAREKAFTSGEEEAAEADDPLEIPGFFKRQVND